MSTIERYRFTTRVTDPLKAQIEIRMEPTPYGDWCHAKDADALIGYLKAENAKLNAMRTPCPHCGADYLATGIEAGCPCRLKARIKQLEALLDGLSDYDPGLINNTCNTVESVRYHVEQANAFWREQLKYLDGKPTSEPLQSGQGVEALEGEIGEGRETK